jgi:NAD(P)-dependent dehydrogenase (short-subunit alcohol dehydrogenase family)
MSNIEEDSGKQIVVTGASNGIGYHTALRLAAGGHTVWAVSRNQQKLNALAAAAGAAGPGRVKPVPMDLLAMDDQALPGLLQAQGVRRVDALINNAGLLINKPFDALSAAEWQRVYGTNVFVAAGLIRQLLPFMGGAGPSHVVNIGSYGGFQGSAKFPGLSAYSSSKAALANLSECLAEEFKDRNIKVNCLALGAVQTEMLSQAFPGHQAPLSSEKMAEFIAWFTIHGAAFFNGKVLPVTIEQV